MSLDYDISAKFSRIYAGIVKWKQSDYSGLIQYTEAIDIPTVVECFCQHIYNNYTGVPVGMPYIIIVVPNLIDKDIYKARDFQFGTNIISQSEFLDLVKDFKGNNKLKTEAIIFVDATNPVYRTFAGVYSKLNKVDSKKYLAITTKTLTPDTQSLFKKLSLPTIDVITRKDAEEHNLLPSYIVYNLGIEFTPSEKKIYLELTEQITMMIKIFKGKAEMVNNTFRSFTHTSKTLIADDFKLIRACYQGTLFINDLNDKPEHISSDTICGMLAEIMGWKKDMPLDNDFNKQVDMYWNPVNIKARAKSFDNAVKKRLALYTNNENKRKAIVALINKCDKGKTLILNENNELNDYIETLNGCMCYYKSMPSRICYNEEGKPILYKSGAKKGEPKVFGELGIRKQCVDNFVANRVNCISTSAIASNVFDVAGLNTIICTAPSCNPFETITDDKKLQSYINKVKQIIFVYMRDFEVNNDEFKLSKEREKLINYQTNYSTVINWVNVIDSIKIR